MNRLIFVFLLIFISFLQSCNNATSKTENANFNELYKDYKLYALNEYDSLLHFYRKLDTIRNIDLAFVNFIRKTVEAQMLYRQSSYDKSNLKYFQANDIIKKFPAGDSLIAFNYIGISNNYLDRSIFDSSFYYLNKAEKIFDLLKNKQAVSQINFNKARLYFYKGDIDKSLEIMNELINDTSNLHLRFKIYHLKANILGSNGRIKEAIALDREIISKFNSGENEINLSPFYNNLSLCFTQLQQFDSALFYCNKSYQIDLKTKRSQNISANLVAMSEILMQMGNYSKSEEYLYNAINEYRKNGNLDRIYSCFLLLNEVSKRQNDFSKSSVLQDSILSFYKKMNNAELDRNIELIKIEYETEKKNHEIEIREAEIEHQRLYLVFILISFIIVLLFLYFYYKYRERKSKLLSLEYEEKVSRMLIDAGQKERERIAGNLHDSVNQKLAVIQMHLSAFELIQPEKTKTVNELLNNAIIDVRSISHNLYASELENGLIAALTQLCEQNNFINSTMQFKLNYDLNGFEKSLKRNTTLIIFRLTQEITNNAIKHSGGTIVEISVAIENQYIVLIIKDDGCGFNTSLMQTDNGIGLRNMMDRVKMINGFIELKTETGKGVEYKIVIPL